MRRLAALLLALALLPPCQAARADGGRRELTLAAVLLDETVERAVDTFNQEDPDYYVRVTDYYDKSTNDLAAALTALNAGDTPDLYDLGGLLLNETDSLIKQGFLADLTDYIEADPDVRREDYLPAVWDAASVDGHIYAAAPAFSVSTLVCRAGDVPAGGMTWERFEQMAREGRPMFLLGDGADPADGRARLLENLLRARFGAFVDEQADTCSFDSRDFSDLLAFVSTVPCSDQTARLAEMAVLFGYGDLAFAPDCIGGELAFCGWPGTDGPVGYLALRGAAAMSAATDCPEGCWAFLRCLLLTDAGYGGLPARLDRQPAAVEKAMAEDGVTQGQVDAINELFTWRYERQSSLKADVLDLARQAAYSYYSGRITAEAAAVDLQSRASLYITEHD